jgi:hypothetical protein
MDEERSRSTDVSRRRFLVATGGLAMGAPLWANPLARLGGGGEERIQPAGPGAKCTPSLKATFVRRRGEYGMRWPGAVYDGKAALASYTEKIRKTARDLGMKLDLRAEPIYSAAEGDSWAKEAKAQKPDGLLVVLLDRQEHAWPTARKAAATGLPTVIFAPVGAAFTTNTASLAKQKGVHICSTDDFRQVAYGMKMVQAAAKLREMRFIVLRGNQRRDTAIEHFGTKLRYLPARTFLDEYRQTPMSDEIKRIAREYIEGARKVAGPTEEDLLNGVKSYVVARRILEREEGDGITMDCLGALGHTKVSLPCIAWSRMLDHGVPAACEADLGAALTHALVQYLFERPGFQQDPVPETARDCLIGAHCTCPTRLHGFSKPSEPYEISHHHGMRDAVPKPLWRVGQRVTVADIELSSKGASGEDAGPRMIVSAGSVVENVAVPPSGGCVVSVMVKLDGVTDLLGDILAYPGFHQLFFYGDYKKELVAYCRLFGIEPLVV